jgi:hypothetical protein
VCGLVCVCFGWGVGCVESDKICLKQHRYPVTVVQACGKQGAAVCGDVLCRSGWAYCNRAASGCRCSLQSLKCLRHHLLGSCDTSSVIVTPSHSVTVPWSQTTVMGSWGADTSTHITIHLMVSYF